MTSIQITLSTENARYVSLLSRVSGGTASKIVNAALDDKREKDTALVDEINALIAKIGIDPTPRAGKKVDDIDQYAEKIARDVEQREFEGRMQRGAFDAYFKR